MPTILPDGVGHIRQSKTVVGSNAAWFNGQPLIDSTAISVFNDGDRSGNCIYCLFGIVSNISVTDIRFTLMSFDVSEISSAPESAELKIFGYSGNSTGDPSSHSSNGIQGWAVNYGGGAMASTTDVTTSDWGLLASAEASDNYMPTKYTDNLTSWNTGTSTPNTFTLTAAALSAIGSEDNFQIAIGHKFWWDSAYSNPPFTAGNSPNNDDDFTAVAGLYQGFGGSYAAYKPQLVLPDAEPNVGPVKLDGAKLQVISGKFLID